MTGHFNNDRTLIRETEFRDWNPFDNEKNIDEVLLEICCSPLESANSGCIFSIAL